MQTQTSSLSQLRPDSVAISRRHICSLNPSTSTWSADPPRNDWFTTISCSSLSAVTSHNNYDNNNNDNNTHTHNRFTAGLEYVRVHPGQQVPER